MLKVIIGADGRSEGNSSIIIFGTVNDISHNNDCYWVYGNDPISFALYVFKDSEEGQKITLGLKDKLDLRDWFLELAIKYSAPLEVIRSFTAAIEVAYENGQEVTKAKFREFLGL